jgi:hypothetical protein
MKFGPFGLQRSGHSLTVVTGSEAMAQVMTETLDDVRKLAQQAELPPEFVLFFVLQQSRVLTERSNVMALVREWYEEIKDQ